VVAVAARVVVVAAVVADADEVVGVDCFPQPLEHAPTHRTRANGATRYDLVLTTSA
jgi:hypothetical protein